MFIDLPQTQPDSAVLQSVQSVLPLVRDHADYADAQRRLHPEVAASFAQAGLYRLPAPTTLHGADADALTQVAVLERVAHADASSGWNLMIGMETFGLLGPSMMGCAHLLSDPHRVMASSTAAVGRAERDGDGWRVQGRWQFVSGIHNATLFGATVQRYENGALLQPEPCYALIEAPDYEVHHTWHTIGLRGSGSHDVSVSDVWVPDAHVVTSIATAKGSSPNLRFPRGPRLAYNKAGVALGIARAAIDGFTDLALGKQPRFSSTSLRKRPFAQRTLAQAEARYLGMRGATYMVVANLWDHVIARERVPAADLARFQAVCSDVAQGTAEIADALAAAAGTSANVAGEPFGRILRDATVIRQHVTVAPHQLEDAGRLLLGLDPTEVMLRGITPDSGE